ncbi:UDP-glycosyltransferase 83A1 [Linum grandiflorum]
MAMKKKPHVLVVPAAAQGHVIPMLKLAQKLNDHGIVVTVVNLDFVHRKINMSPEDEQSHGSGMIRMVSVPDGLDPDFDGSDLVKVTETLETVLPVQLRKLIQQHGNFSWVIADAFISAAFIVAKEMGIKTAALWTASMENLAVILRVPQLIEAGTIDENGSLLNREFPISICEEIPAWKADELPWSCQPKEFQIFIAQHYYMKLSQNSSLFDCFIANSFHRLEPLAFRLLFPDVLPIGPLVTDSTSGCAGSFWRQDQTCSTWLDKHPPKSVIYVAFGSITVLNNQQFKELALGLEMTGRPFLWVIRPNFVGGLEFPDGYLERVANIGKIVEWTNQEEVLSHSSVACFLSHCGWNSTLDGLWCGVPFLCWPYFVDQFHNKESICEAWKVGLKLKAEKDGSGLITMSEIASKVEQLLNDDTIKENANRLKEVARESVKEGGSSFHNFLSFVDTLCS